MIALNSEEDKPFVGMLLLDRSRLALDARIGGKIMIEESNGE